MPSNDAVDLHSGSSSDSLNSTNKSNPSVTVNLKEINIPLGVLGLLPERVSKNYHVVAFAQEGDILNVAMADPNNQETLELLKNVTHLQIQPFSAPLQDIDEALIKHPGVQNAPTASEDQAVATDEMIDIHDVSGFEGPAAQFVQKILNLAINENASDIHFEPMDTFLLVRIRVDGMLKKVAQLPKDQKASVIARVKILANLKIDEQRRPQDGRIQTIVDKKMIDLRVSTYPTVKGEKIVLRILDKSLGLLHLDQLSFAPKYLSILKDNLTKAHGLILVTGPTGSGKSTTLYAMLTSVLSDTVNIITLEDPVEYHIDYINQGQINPTIDFTFANGLRSILRQDPDIIMVGEIRDKETAEIVIHSALTGHLVFSTLHTNSASGAIPRLLDMGVEPFLITSSINLVMAQRLIRKLCPDCRKPMKNFSQEMIDIINSEFTKMPKDYLVGIKDVVFYHSEGCQKCGNTGYRGRMGIHEILPVSPKITQIVSKHSSTEEVQKIAIEEGMLTMKQDGILKALQGLTSIEEIWRITKE